jgi:hypothetical protein
MPVSCVKQRVYRTKDREGGAAVVPVFLQAPSAAEKTWLEKEKPRPSRRQQQEKRPNPQAARFTAPKSSVY